MLPGKEGSAAIADGIASGAVAVLPSGATGVSPAVAAVEGSATADGCGSVAAALPDVSPEGASSAVGRPLEHALAATAAKHATRCCHEIRQVPNLERSMSSRIRQYAPRRPLHVCSPLRRCGTALGASVTAAGRSELPERRA